MVVKGAEASMVGGGFSQGCWFGEVKKKVGDGKDIEGERGGLSSGQRDDEVVVLVKIEKGCVRVGRETREER